MSAYLFFKYLNSSFLATQSGDNSKPSMSGNPAKPAYNNRVLSFRLWPIARIARAKDPENL
jgi:hypothetical protein